MRNAQVKGHFVQKSVWTRIHMGLSALPAPLQWSVNITGKTEDKLTCKLMLQNLQLSHTHTHTHTHTYTQ